MTRAYPSFSKILIAALLALAAVFVPFAALRIILGFAALVIFAISLKKFTGLLITLSVIFILIPAIAMTAVGYFGNVSGFGRWISENVNINRFNFGGISSFSAPHRTIRADTYIKGADNLYIDVTGLKVDFDSSTDTIYLPGRLDTVREGDLLKITSPSGDWNNATFEMVVGTAKKFSDVTIKTVGMAAVGAIKAEDLTFKSVGVDSNVDITAKNLTFDGVGLDVNGMVDSQYIKLNGVGIKIGMDLKNTANVDIHGTSINGYLKYLDEWEGNRDLSLSALSGNLTVWTPSSNSGRLSTIRKSGMVNVSLLKY